MSTGRPAPSWVIAASPHAGRYYPPALLRETRLDLHTLRKAEDAWVDQLLAGVPDLGITTIATDFARAWLDLNRSADELDPLLVRGLDANMSSPTLRVQAGLGVVPRTIGDAGNIYRGRISRGDADARIKAIHAPYHHTLAELLGAAHGAFGRALLVDVHSMPEGSVEAPGADIVLGDRFGASAARHLVEEIAGAFRAHGLVVTRNAPFAGGYATSHYGRPLAGHHAIQIEIARRLYMNETTYQPHEGLERVRAALEHALTAVRDCA